MKTKEQETVSSNVSSNQMPIRAAVVGLGRIGWEYHAQVLMQKETFELSAVCDVEEGRLEKAHQASGCATYRNYMELLSDANVELVVIASQSIDHEPMSIEALQAGKHVLCEKPAALSAYGVSRIIAAAQEAGRVFTVHHNYRLSAEFLYVREIIQSGALGEVFRIKRRNQGFGRRNDWQVLRKYGGGMTGNWGIHLVDQCLCLLDSPIRDVWGDVKQVFNPGDAEDDIKAIIRAESGMTLDIDMTSVNAAPEPSWVVLGNCGTLWIQNDQAHLQFFDPKQLPPLQATDLHRAIDKNEAVGVQPSTEIPWQTRQEAPRPRGAYQDFYDNLSGAIRQHKPLLVEPESALRTYEVLDQIRAGTPFAPT